MHSQSHISWRADIDGLRAIAVLAVVLFHINAHIVPGGFTGVDIFFAISGFLITKIIVDEMTQDRFSFATFYLRRVRRILPAFWVVLCATVVVGYVVLQPGDMLQMLRSARAAAMFIANIFFGKRQGYFAPSADEQPLLHVWSLSVEEQFYFVWPALLLATFALTSRIAAHHRRMSALVVTVLLLIVSFSVSEHLLHTGSREAYYSLLSRAGELLIGALAAIVPFVDRPRTNQWLAALGVAGIAIGLFGFGGDTPFPGWRALLPTASCALVLYSGQSHNGPSGLAARILCTRWLGYVGLLSYSLYLWHWPILAYMHYTYGQVALPATWAVLAAALSLALAALTYHLVEVPAKRLNAGFWKAFSGCYVAPLVLLLAVSVPTSKVLSAIQVDPATASFGRNICHDTLAGQCSRGASGVAPRYLLVGDSHAAMLNAFIDVVGKREGWSADVLSVRSCSPVFGFDTRLSELPMRCDDLKAYLKNNYKKYDAVLFASYWALQLNMTNRPFGPNYLEELNETLRVIARDRPIYVFSDIQRLPIPAARLIRFRRLGLDIKRPEPLETQEANKKIRQLVESLPNVHWIDLSAEAQAFSPDGFYMGRTAYADDNHLNAYGSGELANLMIERGQHLLTSAPPPNKASLLSSN